MAAKEISMKWQKGLAFEASIGDHKIMVDANPEHGGENKGPDPKPLILASFAGCTGMDVVSLLAKMREDLEDFDMNVEADLTEDHPKVFTRFAIEYHLTGARLNPEKVIKAVNMSQEKYCGVAAMLRMIAPVSFKIILNGTDITPT